MCWPVNSLKADTCPRVSNSGPYSYDVDTQPHDPWTPQHFTFKEDIQVYTRRISSDNSRSNEPGGGV